MDDPVWDPTVFTKNRQRLLDGEIATAFLEQVVAQARQRGLLSGEHLRIGYINALRRRAPSSWPASP
jgi:hypothetical protein